MITDIYYRQEQAVSMALRLEKKYKRESLYDSTNSKTDFDIAEVDHNLGMKGLKMINQQYYSVKNQSKSQEKQIPKMNQVEMLFDTVKKTNQQKGYFYYKETQKLQKIISSGQLPYSTGSSQKKIKQGSQNQLSRNNLSSNLIQQDMQQQSDDNFSNSQTNMLIFLEQQLIKATSKFSEQNEMTFAQLGGFLNHILVLQHIKYDETSKLSNEEEIINSQQLDNSFSSEMKLHELFWEVLCYNQNTENDSAQKINSELLFNVTYFLLNKDKQESSPLSLKDNILILLQSFKSTYQNHNDEDGKCQQFPESILDDFIVSWERVVSQDRLNQILMNLTKDVKVKKRRVSFSNSKGSNLNIAQAESQSIKSGSNQNIVINSNAADNSFSSSNMPRGRSQSSSHYSVNMKKKDNPLNVEQDISNLINRIKRHSEQAGVNSANSNNNINNYTAMTVSEGRDRRYTTSSDQRDNLYQSDNILGYQTGKFNPQDDTATIHSLPAYLSKNNNTQSYQNINNNNNSYNQKISAYSTQSQKYLSYQKYEPQGIIQGMNITEVSKDQYEQIQSSQPDYQNEKEVTFGEHKYSSPHDILRRKAKQAHSQTNNLVTPKKRSNQKSQILEYEGRDSLSPSKSKEEARVINLMKQHEEWKQEIIKKWILDKEDKEYEKQKDECTFQPNLGSSKKFNEQLMKNTKGNCDVVSRLYNYQTPKKREIIQYQSLIEKQCQELGECTFKPQTNSKQKQYSHIQSKISHSPISESSSSQHPSASKNKYSSNQKNKEDSIKEKSKEENNLSVKGFEQAVKRMKHGFEKTQEEKARREKIRTGTYYEQNKNKQFKPPSMLERQKTKHTPFYFANITLTNGKHGKISLSEDDDPIQVALNFSKAFQLNKDMTEKLKLNLIDQYKNHMLKLVSSQI